MKTARYTARLLLAAGVLTLLLSLSACFGGNVSVAAKINGSGVVVPVVSGVRDSDRINRELEELLLPYASQAQQTCDASDGRLRVRYEAETLEKEHFFDPAVVLLHLVVSDDKGTVNVCTVKLRSGKLTPETKQVPEWLSSVRLTGYMIDFDRIGLEVDATELDQPAWEELAAGTFVGLYEALAEKPVDISDVAVGEPVGETFQKAIKLGIITPYSGYDSYDYMESVYLHNIFEMSAAVMNYVERDVYGRQSQCVTGSEFSRMLRTFYDACAAEDFTDSQYRWSELGEVNFERVAQDSFGDASNPLTRRDAAEMVCRITEEGPTFSRTYGDAGLYWVEDTDSIWVRRAVTHDFMNYYGDSVIFAPEEEFTVTNAIKNAKNYIRTRYNDWSYATNYEWDGAYTKRDLLMAAGSVYDYFADRPEEEKYDFEQKTVINDRDYQWFFSQKNTGYSSSVNCMPSIATMAAHWYDQSSDATVEGMRATDSIDGGWTVMELRAGLRAYHVPYDESEANLETILSQLDEGKIILVQYSDRPSNMTGHCYVIYGYRKWGDSVTFIINDSDSLTYRAEIFGREVGNGDEVEAKFSLWSILRFVPDTTVVG